jgi:hypothetical protein
VLLKCKGTKKAVLIAAGALVTASGGSGSVSCNVSENTLEVVIPEDLVDISLFIDLLPYILPAGMTCRLTRKTIEDKDLITEVYQRDHYRGDWQLDLGWDTENNTSVGLANLFTPATTKPNFANYTEDNTLNVGLLDNTIIPTLDHNSKKVPTNPQNINESET